MKIFQGKYDFFSKFACIYQKSVYIKWHRRDKQLFRRGTQRVKGAVCKTAMYGFESHPRLQFYIQCRFRKEAAFFFSVCKKSRTFFTL